MTRDEWLALCAAVYDGDHQSPEALTDIVEVHPYDERVVTFCGPRLYLGPPDAQVHKIFNLLTKPIGRPVDVQVLMEAIGETPLALESYVAATGDDIKRQYARIRKAVSLLRQRMREHDVDKYYVVHRVGTGEFANYRLIPSHRPHKRRGAEPVEAAAASVIPPHHFSMAPAATAEIRQGRVAIADLRDPDGDLGSAAA